MSGPSPPPSPFRSLLGVAAASILLLLGLAALRVSQDLQTVREREAVLEQRIREARAQSEQLQRQIERLSRDPTTLEKVARERLGMVYPGDVVLIVPPPGPGATPEAVPGRAPVDDG